MAELVHFDSNLSNVPAAPPDRRRHPRLKCQLPVEIRVDHSSFPMQGETTDVSLCGCYVATNFPLAVGAAIDLRCWVADAPMACKAVVRTSDPGVGNGIEFLDLDEQSKIMLGHYLDALASDKEVNEPTGVIRARM